MNERLVRACAVFTSAALAGGGRGGEESRVCSDRLQAYWYPAKDPWSQLPSSWTHWYITVFQSKSPLCYSVVHLGKAETIPLLMTANRQH